MMGIKIGIVGVTGVALPILAQFEPKTAFEALASGSAQIILSIALICVVTALCRKDKKLNERYEAHLSEQKGLLEGNQKAMDNVAEAVRLQAGATERMGATIKECQMLHRT